jgi:hypothetical protein
LDVLESDRDHTVFTYGRFLVLIWHGETQPGAVKIASRHIGEFISRLNPPRIGSLTIVDVVAAPPSHDARAALAELMKVHASSVIASAVALEGDGFKAAANRCVSTGIALLSRHRFPHRVFAGVRQASLWLAPAVNEEMSSPVNGNSLAKVVAEVRSQRVGRI